LIYRREKNDQQQIGCCNDQCDALTSVHSCTDAPVDWIQYN
jgi:hypothetical protein